MWRQEGQIDLQFGVRSTGFCQAEAAALLQAQSSGVVGRGQGPHAAQPRRGSPLQRRPHQRRSNASPAKMLVDKDRQLRRTSLVRRQEAMPHDFPARRKRPNIDFAAQRMPDPQVPRLCRDRRQTKRHSQRVKAVIHSCQKIPLPWSHGVNSNIVIHTAFYEKRQPSGFAYSSDVERVSKYAKPSRAKCKKSGV